MSNIKKTRGAAAVAKKSGSRSLLSALAVLVVFLGVGGALVWFRKPLAKHRSNVQQDTRSKTTTITTSTTSAAETAVTTNRPAAPAILEINQAVMVTVELDFGSRVPSISEALKQIERQHKPDSGSGRVFAILDAYGQPTPDGKKLHMSMHVSTEKPGIGALVFQRTGEVLWQSRIVSSTNKPPLAGKGLTVFIDDGAGRQFVVDGSGNPQSILDARMRDTGMLVRDFWPDNVEREVTFIYSACSCPVKAMVRRLGERTHRTKELPVMFPDDPPVMEVITRLMGW